MSDGPSPAFSFDENDYARPNQPWQCGWAAEGHACPLGPARGGVCRSAHECSPYKKGNTWVCARPGTNGGPCEEGPLPDGTCCKRIQKCQPTRSIRSRRGVLSFTVFAAAIATAMIILGSPTRQQLVSPGALTSQHSQALTSEQSDVGRCEACHTAAVGGAGAWLRVPFGHNEAPTQSDQCVHCHTELGPNAKSPHGRDASTLAELTALRSQRPPGSSHHSNSEVNAAKAFLARPADAQTELECATCHHEHRGERAELTSLTNQQCQVCHVDSFRGFGDGHPEFSAYPYQRRTRIYFDHLSHYGEHFAAADTPRDRKCSDCHQSDPAGRYMLVKEFEATCAECHTHQIHDDGTLGFAAIALPAVDVDVLKQQGREIGDWPRIFPLHVEADSAVSPLLRLLLQSYDEYDAIEAALVGVDLSDLRGANPAQLEAAEALVWLLKRSLNDVMQNGHPEIHRRLTSVLGSHVSEQQITMLANSYPLSRMVDMQHELLPSLLQEVEARNSGHVLPASESGVSEQAESKNSESEDTDPAEVLIEAAATIANENHQSKMLASGWYLHGSSLSLRYRPHGHADPFLRNLLDISSQGDVNDSDPTSTESILHDLFEQVSSPFAAGRCTKCHTVDRQTSAAARVNWHPYRPRLGQHKFTRFSHAPHVTMLSDGACTTCHLFNLSEASAASLFRTEFIDSNLRPATEPHQFESNFVPMSKDRCAECHTHDSGRDRCLTCHNYHVR